MIEFVSKIFPIYEYVPGAMDSITPASRKEVMILGSEKGYTIGGTFWYTTGRKMSNAQGTGSNSHNANNVRSK